MKFRLGYVAMTLNLEDASPSKTVTFATYNKIDIAAGQLYRLERIARENLENTWRILIYNQALDINVYRLTSKLIPLATHEEVQNWDYCAQLGDELRKIGSVIKENDFRISAHPDHFTLINSASDKILQASIRDLEYHVNLYEAMGLDDYKYKMVLHVGGLYKDKQSSISRFKENFSNLPDRIRKRIILENDDKSFTAMDVLGICQEMNIPMVLDVHHHNCVNNGEKLEDLLPEIFDTWKGEYFCPKVHFSTPKNEKAFRSHADYINPLDFLSFIHVAKKQGRDFDVMLECKMKDTALLDLSSQIDGRDGIIKINNGEFRVD